jgi:hypothetical protein
LEEVAVLSLVSIVTMAQPDVGRGLEVVASQTAFGVAFPPFNHDGIHRSVARNMFGDKSLLVVFESMHGSRTGAPIAIINIFVAKLQIVNPPSGCVRGSDDLVKGSIVGLLQFLLLVPDSPLLAVNPVLDGGTVLGLLKEVPVAFG